MNIVEIIKLKYPDIDLINQVKIQDHGDGNLVIGEWKYKDVPVPSKSDLNAWAIELKRNYEIQEVNIKRASEYPSPESLIIALWESQVENRPEALIELQNKRLAIKEKYKKPI